MECCHPKECIVFDQSEDTEICTECAFVINIQSSVAAPRVQSNILPGISKYKQILNDLCSNNNIPNSIYYSSVDILLRDILPVLKLIKSKFSNLCVCALSLYKGFIKEHAPEHFRRWHILPILKSRTYGKYKGVCSQFAHLPLNPVI